MSTEALEKVSTNKVFGGELVKYKFKVSNDNLINPPPPDQPIQIDPFYSLLLLEEQMPTSTFSFLLVPVNHQRSQCWYISLV